jgi:polyferredoxin
MECIACTACIDACDEIMTKVKKPTGLIRYKALTDGKVQWLRPRVVAYSALVLAATIALVALLALHKPVRVEILRAKNIPYIVSPEGMVRNQFVLKFENHSTVTARLKIVSSAAVNFIIPQNPLTLEPEAKQEIPIFIEAAQNQFEFGKLPVEIKIQNEADEGRVISSKALTILGPMSQGGTDGK